MARYDLYEELKLDRTKAPADLAAELDDRLRGVSWEDKATHEQLTVARKILGDPAKRSMYDQRLDDPSATIDIDNLRGLANQEVTASRSPSMTGAMAVEKVKGFYRTDRKPKLAGTAVAAVAALGLVGAGIASCGSDDEETSAAGTTTPADAQETSSGSSGDAFDQYTFLEPGEELVLTTGKLYEYDDGRTERSGGGEYGFTVDNLRTVDQLSAPDPDAPSDHPDSKAQKVGTYVCYDLTFRVITPTGEQPDSSGIGDVEDFVVGESQEAIYPKMLVYPIMNGYLGSELDSGNLMSVPPGSTAPFEKSEYGSDKSADGASGYRYDTENLTETTSNCRHASDGDESDLPDGVRGYVVGSEANDNTTPDQDVQGWRFDL